MGIVQLLFSCVPLSCDPMDCSPSGSSVHGISQARILMWVDISFSRGSSWPRDGTCVSCISRWILYHWATQRSPEIQQVFSKFFWTGLNIIVFLKYFNEREMWFLHLKKKKKSQQHVEDHLYHFMLIFSLYITSQPSHKILVKQTIDISLMNEK